MGVSVLVRCSLLMLCFVFVSKAQEVGVTSLSITNAATVTYTAGGTGQTITVTLELEETADDTIDGEVTAINVYFTNNADLRYAYIVKSDPVVHTLEFPVDVTAGDIEWIDEEIWGILIDVEDCQWYSHVCVEITALDDTDDSDDFECLIFGTTVGTEAGTKICPDIAASAFSISSPSNITYDTDNDTDITFGISAAATDGDGTVTGVKLYFTDSDDYDTASTTSVAFNAGNVAFTSVTDGTTEPITGATASLKLDAANCDDYTHLCADLQISSTDTITSNNDVCIAFGTEAVEAGSKNCGGDSATSVSSFSFLFLLFFAIAAKFAM